MRKIIYTVLLVFVMLFALAVSSYAAEYTVANNDQYASAYEQAISGDTIIITGKLTCNIQATKSVTYILRADWESAEIKIANNADVLFVADGGNYKIMPTNYSTANGWLNVDTAYTGVVLGFAGVNGGTLTFDGSNATNDRVSYVTASSDITWNFFSGSAIANFCPTTNDTSNDTVAIIYARYFNIYDGCQIYANKIAGAPLVKSTNIHMYGGEIFGNIFASPRTIANGSGVFYANNQLVIWDGSLYGNIFNAKGSNNNNIGFFTVLERKHTVIIGCTLGENYVSGTSQQEVSAMFGSTSRTIVGNGYYSSDFTFGTRKIFSSGTSMALAYDEQSGKTIWKLVNPSFDEAKTSAGWTGFSWIHAKGLCDNMVSFFDVTQRRVCGNTILELDLKNLFVINVSISNVTTGASQKNYTYSYTGATTLTIPSGVEAWSSTLDGYCHNGSALNVSDIDSSAPVAYYASYTNPIVTEDLVTFCSICSKVLLCENADHGTLVYITYEDYSKEGVKTITCANCGVAETESVPAIFFCPGFSNPENDNYAIAVGYTVNLKALAEFKELSRDGDLKFGVMVVNPNHLDGKNTFMVNGLVNASSGVLQVDMSNSEYSNVSVVINGFTGKAENLSLVIALYAYTDKDEVVYIQSETTKCASAKVTKDDGVLYTVTYKSVLNANTSVSDLDEYVVPKKEQEE